MIILFGIRRRVVRLATIFVMCGYCHTPAAHALTRGRRYFTLFFVPVIPLSTKYYTTCTLCGRATHITKEGADHYLAHANDPGQPAQAPMPTQPANSPTAPSPASSAHNMVAAPPLSGGRMLESPPFRLG